MPNETAIDLSQKLLEVISLKKEDLDTVKELIAAGANINIQDANECTPLHVAAISGHEGITKILLNNAANIYAKAPKGMTAFLIAAAHGHVGIVTLFLTLDKEFIHDKNIFGYNALHLAAQYDRDEMIGVLLKYGIDIDARTSEDTAPLHIAIFNDFYNTTKKLLHYGASIDVVYKNNYPLHYAAMLLCCYAAMGNNTHALLALLENEKVQECINDFNTADDAVTPLHIAAYHGKVEALALLLQHGANIRDKSNSKFHQTDYTPLSLAIIGASGYSLDFIFNFPKKTDAGYIVHTLQGKFETARPDIIYLDPYQGSYAVVTDHSTIYTGSLSAEHIALSTLSPESREDVLQSPIFLQEILGIVLKNKPSLNRRALAVEILLHAGADGIALALIFAKHAKDADVIKILNDEKNLFIKRIKNCIIQCLTIAYKDSTHIEIIKILMDNYKISETKRKNKTTYEIRIRYASLLECLSAYLIFKKESLGIKIFLKEPPCFLMWKKKK